MHTINIYIYIYMYIDIYIYIYILYTQIYRIYIYIDIYIKLKNLLKVYKVYQYTIKPRITLLHEVIFGQP